METGMDSMLEMYLFETNTLIAQLEDILISAEKDKDFTDEHINEIFRIMHTIKGSSAMMDFVPLMTISHRIEDLFFFIREKGTIKDEYRRELFDLVFHSVDYIIGEIGKLESGEPLNPNIDNYVKDINNYLEKISTGKVSDADKEEPSAAQTINDENFEEGICVHFEEGAGMENLRAYMLVNAIRELGIEPIFEPADVETNSETAQTILENGFLIKIRNEEEKNAVQVAIQNSVNIRGYELVNLLEKQKEEKAEEKQAQGEINQNKNAEQKPTSNPVNNPAHPAGTKQSLISVNLSKLDKLMAIVGEIVITESMVTSSPDLEGLKLDSFTKASRQLRKLNSELQDIAMSLRMVPVAGVFQKMNRIVRDMCKKLGKDVTLIIEGEDTEVDKSIVDNIGDPIMHIVRNSMDHGIESVEEREKAGKDRQGTIVLSASHTGSEVIISIQDDGKGIDVERILDKAESRGLLVKPRSEYTKKEAISLIMSAGFSTNDNVTEFSGRGVGMDVVRKNIEALGGSVVMMGELGEGTTTLLKIPLTLAIVAGMETAVGESTFTIPINNIRQSFKISADEVIRNVDGKEMIKKMDEFFPIIRLNELYHIESKYTNLEDGILIWVEAGDRGYCLFVDELIGEQQVVVKPLPTYLNNYNIKNSGIAGCTIMGNGNISLILDIANLYAMSNSMY